MGEAFARGTGPLAEHVGALADLRSAGLVRHLGISNVGAELLTEAMTIAPVVCVQNLYGLTTRSEDDALVAMCAEPGVEFVPFFSVGAGVPGVSPWHGVDEAGKDEIAAVAAAHDVTAAPDPS